MDTKGKLQKNIYLEDVYKRVCGYINIKVLDDEDYLYISRKFKNIITDYTDSIDSKSDNLSWFYYLADFLMLEFYYTKYDDAKKLERKIKSQDRNKKKEYLNQLKLKYTYFYYKIVEDHKDYYDKMIERFYKPVYQITGFVEENSDIFYDFITLNREFIMYEFVSVNNDRGSMHEKLIFCYRSFINGWSSRRIIEELRKKTLCQVLINFINEYSRISGLPQAVLLFYFYPIEEGLYRENIDKTKLNLYFSRIDVIEFLKLARHKHVGFIRNIYDKRMNAVDKWCNRLRERLVRDMVNKMVKLVLTERS